MGPKVQTKTSKSETADNSPEVDAVGGTSMVIHPSEEPKELVGISIIAGMIQMCLQLQQDLNKTKGCKGCRFK